MPCSSNEAVPPVGNVATGVSCSRALVSVNLREVPIGRLYCGNVVHGERFVTWKSLVAKWVNARLFTLTHMVNARVFTLTHMDS